MMPNLKSSHGSLRLAHGWRLSRPDVPEEIIRNFIRPACVRCLARWRPPQKLSYLAADPPYGSANQSLAHPQPSPGAKELLGKTAIAGRQDSIRNKPFIPFDQFDNTLCDNGSHVALSSATNWINAAINSVGSFRTSSLIR